MCKLCRCCRHFLEWYLPRKGCWAGPGHVRRTLDRQMLVRYRDSASSAEVYPLRGPHPSPKEEEQLRWGSAAPREDKGEKLLPVLPQIKRYNCWASLRIAGTKRRVGLSAPAGADGRRACRPRQVRPGDQLQDGAKTARPQIPDRCWRSPMRSSNNHAVYCICPRPVLALSGGSTMPASISAPWG